MKNFMIIKRNLIIFVICILTSFEIIYAKGSINEDLTTGLKKIKVLDVVKHWDDFGMAYLNKKENTNISNGIPYKGDEFSYHEDKKKFKKIRSYKYILFKYSGDVLPEYDFRRNSFVFKTKHFKVWYGENINDTLFEFKKNVFMKVEQTQAKKLKRTTFKYELFLLLKIIGVKKEKVLFSNVKTIVVNPIRYYCIIGDNVLKNY